MLVGLGTRFEAREEVDYPGAAPARPAATVGEAVAGLGFSVVIDPLLEAPVLGADWEAGERVRQFATEFRLELALEDKPAQLPWTSRAHPGDAVAIVVRPGCRNRSLKRRIAS